MLQICHICTMNVNQLYKLICSCNVIGHYQANSNNMYNQQYVLGLNDTFFKK